MNCRHCGSTLQLPFLDLGSAPPSNAYLTEAGLRTPEKWYPLRLLVCEQCWLVQTEDHAGREELFTQDYAYFSSFSSSWLAHAQAYLAKMQELLHLDADSLVAEVAANDGYLLQYVQKAGIPCYGVEPTASTAAAAKEKGIDIVERFFGVELAEELAAAGRSADLMAANNVLAHVPDINDFVAGFALLLKPAGVATFEFPHLLNMALENQFDTAYHEHYSYLSLTTVEKVFNANGLSIFDVEEIPTHGGSLRVYAQRASSGVRQRTGRPDTILQHEAAAGMHSSAFYEAFQAKAEQVKNRLLAFLLDARNQNLKVAAYGAAAKGNTLLNFAGVRPDLLPYVVDKNPAKQGRFLPGSRIPIVSEERLKQDQPDLVLILPWNIAGEVMEQQCQIREWGGRFVTAVPQLRLL